jgi:hypothetical protein
LGAHSRQKRRPRSHHQARERFLREHPDEAAAIRDKEEQRQKRKAEKADRENDGDEGENEDHEGENEDHEGENEDDEREAEEAGA